MYKSGFAISPYNVLVLLVVILPFEEFLWGSIGLRGDIYSIMRLMSEMLIYALLTLVIVDAVRTRRGLAKTPIDKLLLGFLFFAILPIAIMPVSLLASVIALRVLLRYVAIYYIIVNINLTPTKVIKLMRIVIATAIVEGIIVLGQRFVPSFNAVFERNLVGEVAIAGIAKHFSVEKAGAVLGTFDVGAALMNFGVVSAVILFVIGFGRRGKINVSIGGVLAALIIIFAVFASYKRIGLVLLPVLLCFVILYSGNKKRTYFMGGAWVLSALVVVPILIVGVDSISVDSSLYDARALRSEQFSFFDFMLTLFTPQYWSESSSVSRLWFMREVGLYLIQNMRLIGMGPDTDYVLNAIGTSQISDFSAFVYGNYSEAFDDVYWLAMAAYYGILGAGMFASIMVALYKVGRALLKIEYDEHVRMVGVLLCVLVVYAVLINFVQRAFEIKSFSFYFWMFSGIAVNLYRTTRKLNAALALQGA